MAKKNYEEYDNVEMHEVFSRYRNSIVRHLGVERTLKAMRGLGCAKTSPHGLVNVVFVRRSNISVNQGLRTKLFIICIGSRIDILICRYAGSIETRRK